MFKGQDLASILDRVRDVKIQYITLGIILVIVFVCCEYFSLLVLKNQNNICQILSILYAVRFCLII